MFKDLKLALETALDMGTPMPLITSCREMHRKAVESGRGALDFAAVTEPPEPTEPDEVRL